MEMNIWKELRDSQIHADRVRDPATQSVRAKTDGSQEKMAF